MNTVEKAKAIRKKLKEMGWNARMVSVRARSFSLGSAIDVTVKSPEVDVVKVREVVAEHERVRRCEVSGEILGGGNTYTHVKRSDECRAEMGAPYVAAMKVAVEKARSLPRGQLVDVSPPDFSVEMESPHTAVLWRDRPVAQFHPGSESGIAEGAAYLAMAIADGEGLL